MDHFRRLVGKHITYPIYKKYSNYKLFFSKEKYIRIKNFPFKLRGGYIVYKMNTNIKASLHLACSIPVIHRFMDPRFNEQNDYGEMD